MPSLRRFAELRHMRRMLPSQWLRVGGFRLHARVAPRDAPASREPVVLVHGFGVSSRYMVPVGRLLAAERPVFAPDMPAHGRSEKPQRALDITRLAAMLDAYMDAAGIPHAVLLANSMGCQVAVELAIANPARVRRLVLVGPTVDPTARSGMRQLLRLLASAIGEHPAIVPVLALDYLRMGPRLLWQELRAMLDHRIEERLPLVTQPVLVVRGQLDRIVPQRWADEVDRLAGGSGNAVQVRRWGHALNFSAPAELLQAVIPFIREEDREDR